MKPVTSIRLSDELKAALQQLANADNRNLSNYIESVLSQHVERQSKMKTINGIEYYNCGSGNLGQALAAYLVAQYAGHNIEVNGSYYYHNAAWTPEIYQDYVAAALR